MLSPVVSHVPCALDHHRRIREARTDALARSSRRRGRRRSAGTSADQAAVLGTRGEDVWGALRV
jgi:adenosylcobinamide amidohydrolase